MVRSIEVISVSSLEMSKQSLLRLFFDNDVEESPYNGQKI